MEGRAELLSTCYKSVICLPAVDALQKEASSPKEAQANVVINSLMFLSLFLFLFF